MASILGMRTRRGGTGPGSWISSCQLSGLLWDWETSGGFPTELMIMEEVRERDIFLASLFSRLHKTNSTNIKLSFKISSCCQLYCQLVQTKESSEILKSFPSTVTQAQKMKLKCFLDRQEKKQNKLSERDLIVVNKLTNLEDN